jgi:hypothetical protein
MADRAGIVALRCLLGGADKMPDELSNNRISLFL